MNIRKMIEDNPIRVECPVCGERFEGIFAVTKLMEHFDSHPDKNLSDYTPIRMVRI